MWLNTRRGIFETHDEFASLKVGEFPEINYF